MGWLGLGKWGDWEGMVARSPAWDWVIRATGLAHAMIERGYADGRGHGWVLVGCIYGVRISIVSRLILV